MSLGIVGDIPTFPVKPSGLSRPFPAGQAGFCDFNLFSSGGYAPVGINPQTRVAGGLFSREQWVLNSMTMSAVPEPGNLLGLSGLVGAAAFLRVRRRGAGMVPLA